MYKLKVKKSTIKNAGLGLFTDSFIPKNSTITLYPGKIINRKEYQSMLNTNPRHIDLYYVVEIDKILIIADHKSRNKNELGHLINDVDMLDYSQFTLNDGIRYINSYHDTNCELVLDKKNKLFYVVSLKDIEENSELFIHYGIEYWLPANQFINITDERLIKMREFLSEIDNNNLGFINKYLSF